MKPKVINCEIFKVVIHYFIKWTAQDFQEYMKTQAGISVDTKGRGLCVEHYGNVYIWSCKKNGGPDTLIHESVHAATMILRHVDIDARNDDGELMAYLTEFIHSKALSKEKR